MGNDWSDLRGMRIPSGEESRRLSNLDAQRRWAGSPMRWLLPAILALEFLVVGWPDKTPRLSIGAIALSTCVASGYFFALGWQGNRDLKPRERWMHALGPALIFPVLVITMFGLKYLAG